MMEAKLYWNEEIETLSRDELDRLQEALLTEHLALAYNKSDYYKEAFDKAGVKPAEFKQRSDINKFPFVNKYIECERQLHKPLLGAWLLYLRKKWSLYRLPAVQPAYLP